MIKVWIYRSAATEQIVSFKVAGHANYAERGKDIVCAAVSAVTVGTVNSIQELTGIEMIVTMRDGFLEARLSENLTESALRDAQLLLKSMLVMLRSIETAQDDVGKFLSLKEKRS